MRTLLRNRIPRLHLEVATTCGALAIVALAMGTTAMLALPAMISGALLLLAALSVAPIIARFALASGDWFHPYAFPLCYITLALTAPAVYLGLAGQPLEALPSAVTGELAALFVFVILGVAGGMTLGLTLWRRRPTSQTSSGLDYGRMLILGRMAIPAATALKAYVVSGQLGETYGTGSVSFGATHSIDVLAGFLFLAGIALVTVANARLRGSVLSKVDVAMVVPFILATLASGGRDEVITAVLFTAWAQHTLVRRILLVHILAGGLALLLVFQGVVAARAGESVVGGVKPLLDRTLVSIGTPTFDATETFRRVPEEHDFTMGSTYLAALKRQLPGPLTVKLFGAPDDTGAYVFRDLLGFDDPNAGFGFSLPSEGYLNFGLFGGAGAALVAGLFLGYAFRRSHSVPVRPVHLLYPIAIASLPTTLRSDALGQLKSVLYPMAALTAAFWLCGAYRGHSLRTLIATKLDPRRFTWRPPLSRPTARPRPSGQLLWRSRAILAAALVLPPVSFAGGLRQRDLFDGPTLSTAVATATGIPLQRHGRSPTRAVDVLSAYSGATSGESIIVVICGNERDAGRLADGRSLGRIKALRGRNAVVFYVRGSGVPDRTRQIIQVLGRQPV